MGFDVNEDVGQIPEGELQSRKSEAMASDGYQGKGSFLYDHKGHDAYIEYVAKVNQRLFPEGDRQAVPESDRGLRDLLQKEGFKTSEEVEAMGQEARQAIQDQQDIEDTANSMSALHAEWGSDTERNINLAKALIDTYANATEEDKAFWNGPAGRDFELIKRLHSLADYLNKHYWEGKASNYKREEK